MTMPSHSDAAGPYRFFAIGSLEKVLALREIDCSNDTEATATAQVMIQWGYGIEVWDIGRRVIKLNGKHETNAVTFAPLA